VALATTAAVAMAGWVITGAGLAVLAPSVLGAAPDRAANTTPAAAIASVTTLGYLGSFAGPPIIGGLAGAVGLSAAGTVEVPAPPVDVVDTVGAGDAFMSGLLDALAAADVLGPERAERLRAISPDGLGRAVTRAVRVAALTCARAGANPPTREELVAAYPDER
jgi:sugar/nucleoside kinase (ribokinase family)